MKKKLIIILFTLFILATGLRSVHAEEVEDPCLASVPYLIGTGNHCLVKFALPNIDVDSTISTLFTGTLNNLIPFIIFHRGADELGVCGIYNLPVLVSQHSDISEDAADALIRSTLVEQGGGYENENLLTFEQYDDAREAGESLDCDLNASFWSGPKTDLSARRNVGSLAGIATTLGTYVTTEAPPVSLAYYFQHNIQKIPVLNNTALAATSYPIWGVDIALSIWETTRNFAYGLIALFMLVIGIMIITRKRINPQTIVTVQSALPRVVISLILITFSYPIGATLMSLMLPLTVLAIKMFLGFGLEDIGNGVSNICSNSNVNCGIVNLMSLNTIVQLFNIAFAGGQGLMVLLASMFLILFTLGIFLWAIIKAILIQMKLLMAIMIAPIQFAIAAIPGNENLITTWFKSFIAKVLAVPAMIAMLGVAWYFLAIPFTDSITFLFTSMINPSPSVFSLLGNGGLRFIAGSLMGVVGKMMSIVMLPIMTIVISFMAIGAPKKVEEFIMGESSGGKKRK